MSLTKRMLRWKAVYWGPTGALDDFGKKVFKAPVQIKCRWEDTTEVFVDKDGEEAVSSAKVFVDRVLEELGVLRFGTLAQLTSTTDPFANSKAYEIRKFSDIPGTRVNRPHLLMAWL